MKQIFVKRKNGINKKIKVLFLLIFFTFFLNYFSSFISNTSFFVASPIQNFINSSGKSLSDWKIAFFSIGEVVRQKEDLIEQRNLLLSKIVYFEEIKKENDFLRQALGLGFDKDFELILARISTKDIGSDSFVINMGKIDGVLEGMPIITENKIIVGQVSEVYDNFSRVKMITHDDFGFDVQLQKNEVIGFAEGMGGFSVSINLIPREVDLSEGDVVMTAPLGGVFPHGLFVGVIRDIQKNEAEIFQEAKIIPFFNPQKISRVFVITEAIQP